MTISYPLLFSPILVEKPWGGGRLSRYGRASSGTCDEQRTIRVDASRVVAPDVRLGPQDQDALFDAGVSAVERFLAIYDHDRWVADCR
jgi:hypothetical protein